MQPRDPYVVLLVDDDVHNRKIFETVLRHAGFAVRVAAAGDEALSEVQRGRPDLILMDLSIPVIDGWECTRRLKADPATQEIQIIALTAHAMRGDEERALAAGCDGYLSKPISPRKLVEAVKQRLGLRS
jgi:two-component system cell cycle response regulator DivK